MLSGIFSVACFFMVMMQKAPLFASLPFYRVLGVLSGLGVLSFAPFGGYAEEDFEVYAGHGA